MELRSTKKQTGRSSKPDMEVEARKRQRTSEGPILVGLNDRGGEDMRYVLDGHVWEDSSSSEYEAHF